MTERTGKAEQAQPRASRARLWLFRWRDWSVRPIVGVGAAAMAVGVKVAAGSGARSSAELAAWSAALFILVLYLWPNPTPRKDRWLDANRLVLIVLGLYFLPSVYTRVGGDGVEYFVQARSLLFDHDLDFANDYEGLGKPPVLSSSGEITSRFPVGVALLWVPPLALTHALVRTAALFGWSGAFDGFSEPYQSAVTVATYLYAFVALLLLDTFLRRFYPRAVVSFSVVGTWLASPLLFYMTANASMSHGLSAFAVTLFVWRWLAARSSGSERDWLWAGLAGGLMSLVRVQNATLLLLPVVDLIIAAVSGKKERLRPAGFYLAGPAVFGLLQIAVWIRSYGFGFAGVIRTQSMVAVSGPHVMEFLFSSRHGLLSWTPIYLGALLGWLFWLRRDKVVSLSFWMCFALAVLLNGSTGDWWSSESFGQRRLVGYVPLFAMGLGACIETFKKRPLIPLGAMIAFLVFWNLQLAYIYNGQMVGGKDEALPFDRVVAAQVDVGYRRLLRADSWMPRILWVQLYDALKGVWLFGPHPSLGGRIDLGREREGYYPLVGDGWFEPQLVGDESYRLSRGRRSWLFVAIRDPGTYRLRLRLRRELNAPVALRLDMNGRALGEQPLSEGWKEYVFDAPSGVARSGFNEIVLVYSTTPRLAIPGFHGQNAVLALDRIVFEPAPP